MQSINMAHHINIMENNMIILVDVVQHASTLKSQKLSTERSILVPQRINMALS